MDIDGVDIFSMRFDPEMFSAEVVDHGLLGLTVYSQVDNDTGTVKFSQLASWGTTFRGHGDLITVNLTAKSAGTSSVSFDHAPGATHDTNVASRGIDVLGEVEQVEITVTE
jgi:hypothetical protein